MHVTVCIEFLIEFSTIGEGSIDGFNLLAGEAIELEFTDDEVALVGIGEEL